MHDNNTSSVKETEKNKNIAEKRMNEQNDDAKNNNNNKETKIENDENDYERRKKLEKLGTQVRTKQKIHSK